IARPFVPLKRVIFALRTGTASREHGLLGRLDLGGFRGRCPPAVASLSTPAPDLACRGQLPEAKFSGHPADATCIGARIIKGRTVGLEPPPQHSPRSEERRVG